MKTLFLSKDELVELIGFKNKSKQVNFLRMRGMPFYLTNNNEPRVLRQLIEDNSHVEEIILKQKWKPKVIKWDN